MGPSPLRVSQMVFAPAEADQQREKLWTAACAPAVTCNLLLCLQKSGGAPAMPCLHLPPCKHCLPSSPICPHCTTGTSAYDSAIQGKGSPTLKALHDLTSGHAAGTCGGFLLHTQHRFITCWMVHTWFPSTPAAADAQCLCTRMPGINALRAPELTCDALELAIALTPAWLAGRTRPASEGLACLLTSWGREFAAGGGTAAHGTPASIRGQRITRLPTHQVLHAARLHVPSMHQYRTARRVESRTECCKVPALPVADSAERLGQRGGSVGTGYGQRQACSGRRAREASKTVPR